MKTSWKEHADWNAPADRTDVVDVLEQDNEGRLSDLVPVRYGKMAVDPFNFFRGAASVMAMDLAACPRTKLNLQACGDCHVGNFGVFATPERRLVFDLNDFDETHPAPWEWDVKRLAASFVVAGRAKEGIGKGIPKSAALAAARGYRVQMAGCAQRRALDVWYDRIDAQRLQQLALLPGAPLPDDPAAAAAAHANDMDVLTKKLTEVRGGRRRLKDFEGAEGKIFHDDEDHFTGKEVEKFFDDYRRTLQGDRRAILDRFAFRDAAMKVVGVGSVGTRCALVLLAAGRKDALFLQCKEARASVLAPYVDAPPWRHQGERVVSGQRLLQCASDIFLGWTEAGERAYYFRQYRDRKMEVAALDFAPLQFLAYAELCGTALARAHAKAGDAARIAAHFGDPPRFERAIARFATRYADQNERDYQALLKAIHSGRIKAASPEDADKSARPKKSKG